MTTRNEKIKDNSLELYHRGIYVGYYEASLEKNYPFIVDWLKSEDGQLFLKGKKEVLLVGCQDAVHIGNLLQLEFFLESGQGLVTSLCELAEMLTIPAWELDKDFKENINTCSTIFVSSFQEPGDCPLDTKEIYKVSDYIRKRHVKPQFGQTVLQISDEELNWWPKSFQDFVNDSFFRVNCDRIK